MLQIWLLYDFYFLVCAYFVAKPYFLVCAYTVVKPYVLTYGSTTISAHTKK